MEYILPKNEQTVKHDDFMTPGPCPYRKTASLCLLKHAKRKLCKKNSK